ncbi:MAG TPA: hypothetical protein VF483_01320, partial [Gemmatimonadaceae bacterium]
MRYNVVMALGMLALAGCADAVGSGSTNAVAVGSAFQSVPFGMSSASTSFDAAGDVGPFFPGQLGNGVFPGAGERADGDRDGVGEHEHDGFEGAEMRGRLMGGGLGPDFLGFVRFGRGLGRGPFGVFHLSDACTFEASSGRVLCPDRVEHDLSVTSSFAFKDTAGVAQSEFDTLSTNSVNERISVSGTHVRRDSSTTTVNDSSDRTVTGLAPGSTSRTIDGVANGVETTTGTRDGVGFTAVRTVSDTTTGLVIPLRDGHPTSPSAGVVVRSMSVTITPTGGTATTRSRREQVTFDGTN